MRFLPRPWSYRSWQKFHKRLLPGDLEPNEHQGWHPKPKILITAPWTVSSGHTWSQILSGWPSPTDSEVNRKVSDMVVSKKIEIWKFFRKIRRMNPPGIKGCLYNFFEQMWKSLVRVTAFFKFIIAQIKLVSVKKWNEGEKASKVNLSLVTYFHWLSRNERIWLANTEPS